MTAFRDTSLFPSIPDDALVPEMPRDHLLMRLLPEHPQATAKQSQALARKRILYNLALTLADGYPGSLLGLAESHTQDPQIQALLEQFLFD